MKDIFENTRRITFELSNICDLAPFHKKCGAHEAWLHDEPTILPSKIVYHVLDTLTKYKYKWKICFHRYNEPLIDPRLFKFIEYARKACPQSILFLVTNGTYLTQTLMDELEEAGLSGLRFSAYTDRDYERLSKIKTNIDFRKRRSYPEKFDDSVQWYKEVDSGNFPHKGKKKCHAPLADIEIDKDGQVVLCCEDWKSRHVFGDLREQTLEEIVMSKEIQGAYARLRQGDRYLDFCKRCHTYIKADH